MAKLGSILIRFVSLPSTNDRARDMAVSGVEEGLTVVAARQTAGRGRHGRSWVSPTGEGLYVSVVLRPLIKSADSPIIALAAAVAVAETLALDFQIPADIKWPNDVLVNGKKICGILVEAATEGDRLQYAVLGIGVNVGQREFPDDLGQGATSIFLESRAAIAPDDVLRPLLDRLETWYRTTLARPLDVTDRWERLSSSARGKVVRIISADGEFEGTTRGLTPHGALRIETPGGATREVVASEVSLRPSVTA